jgi:hypothetical protein
LEVQLDYNLSVYWENYLLHTHTGGTQLAKEMANKLCVFVT